jgi:hypothetical protein
MTTDDLISRVMKEMGRRGGTARAKAMTPKQRRDSALKASKAAALSRSDLSRKTSEFAVYIRNHRPVPARLLDDLVSSKKAMPKDLCGLLGLPERSTYGRGAEKYRVRRAG